MKFKQIVENSLFTNNIEKAALIADDHKLMDAFYINFIGFIGLFSIKKLAPLKTYEKEEGKLQVNSITDTNKDVMNELIKKHKDVVTEGIKYKFFRQFVNEISAPKEKNMRYVNFTFMDNIVPLTNRKYYDLEEKPEQNLKKLLPKDARIDHGQYGVIISFPYKEDINIRLLYGTDIETDSKVRNLYQSFFK